MRTLVLRLVVVAAALTVLLFPSTPPVVHISRVERKPAAPISGPNGAPPRYAVGDFAAVDGTAEQTASEVRDVIRQDLQFEDAFDVVDSDADALLFGAVREDDDRLEVEAHLVNVATGEEVFARGYTAALANARLLAHTASDEIVAAEAGVPGVARTRLAFVSDRGGTRRELGGMIRRFKEVWTADYDGAHQRRLTSDGDLDMTPSWAPDGRAIAYTSFRRGFQDIFITFLDDGRVESPTRGVGKNWLPAWSPDGRRLAFTSVRDGNEEIYVANPDGSDVRRLTHHPAIDTSPAWSPDGNRLAFTSNRSGRPQIWVMDAGGANPRQLTAEKYCDRPTWSPGPDDEIAYVSKTKTGFDIKVMDVRSGASRQLTFGQGFNESPAFAPNGRHLAFTSTRRGGEQVWVVSRTGTGLRQVTTVGNNSMPAWSK